MGGFWGCSGVWWSSWLLVSWMIGMLVASEGRKVREDVSEAWFIAFDSVSGGKLIEREWNFEENLLLLSQIFGCQLIYSLIIHPKFVSLMTINKTSIIATTTQPSTLLPHCLSSALAIKNRQTKPLKLHTLALFSLQLVLILEIRATPLA
jgi:hypothetical protein